jgi:hypothetical protein
VAMDIGKAILSAIPVQFKPAPAIPVVEPLEVQ